MTNYKLTGDTRGESLVIIYASDDPVTIPSSHPKFDEILELLRSGDAEDDQIAELVNEVATIGKRLAALSPRVTVTPYAVMFDNHPLTTVLGETIRDLYNAGQEEALVATANFLARASENPSIASIDAMYKWITNKQLILSAEGTFFAYKGVNEVDGKLFSVNHGTAYVDGVKHVGAIPNEVGTTISMPRSEVNADNRNGCSTGLHAGTHNYARQYAYNGALLLVEIDPRHVVSVPNDSSFQKLRVSEYKVIQRMDENLGTGVYAPVTEDLPEDDDGDFTDATPVQADEKSETAQYFEDALAEATAKEETFAPLRDEKGKFVKGGKIQAARDAFGRFIKGE